LKILIFKAITNKLIRYYLFNKLDDALKQLSLDFFI